MDNQLSRREKLKQKLQELFWDVQDMFILHPKAAWLSVLGLAGAALSAAFFLTSYTVCYTVDAEGKNVAFFQDEATYSAAVTQAEERASRILNTEYSFDQDLTVSKSVAGKGRVEDLPQMTDSIMDIIPELEHVYTLWVDGMMLGAAEDSDTLCEAMQMVTDQYITPNTLSVRVSNQVSIRYEYLPVEAGVSSAQDLAALLAEETLQTFPYTVQKGDTLEDLLNRFGMTQERLQELNPEANLESQTLAMGLEEIGAAEETADTASTAALDSLLTAELGTHLEPGMELTIEQTCPRLMVYTVEEQKFTRPTAPDIQTEPDSTMFYGEQRILQEGEAGEENVLARVVTRCGVTVTHTDLSSITTTESVPMIVSTGTQERPQLPDGCLFLWPVQGHISSDFGYRFIFGENNFHRGVDIPAPMGTAINAGADGVVSFAGVKGTYGNLVVLTHENGFQTYYAHCSKILVKVGDTVTQGTPIAAVGSTGRSTGPHCHFEVRYQNNPIDPLLYLPGTNNAPARTEIPLATEPEPQEPVTQPEPSVKPDTPVAPETPAEPQTPVTPTEPEQPAEPNTQPEDSAPAPEQDVFPDWIPTTRRK